MPANLDGEIPECVLVSLPTLTAMQFELELNTGNCRHKNFYWLRFMSFVTSKER